ncbi:MAG TPA: phospho-N-acetylmuramoyl-pentapeptide-transferase [Chitinophagaceae bacterium]|jgi:phospho-N-acetylmuramoyl-pentapeptide-transferase|nr:phospho-N-acetylmuramoyl-pentapeptide-transferase [Chitinophagaceae bacterium]HNA96574.1 phospho-N-acetylmuramoyl-pentapeptide-transferase [Chitinophagaceae bacterium]HNJ24831.1 phospho-N-acetylmuramoyl-pentapeptide-transferase [Chitinophagaceae bacterium]HNK59978.1 phospho-N-acetylmuramoyl-pentapeptide-transferase [Chitinophagaceae bacterium]HNO54073.1 phospho-N-acetylmuramoyl-pentapeptide-transferase [Chitinophagaceae bacterium]
MLYHLYKWLEQEGIHIPGMRLFDFITFRVLVGVMLSLFITAFYGKKLIKFLQKKQIGESIREEGLAGQESKRGTPTMGGIIIVFAIIIPTLLLANLTNVYVQVMLLSTVWMGAIGFIDDYLKLRGKKIAQQKGEVYKKTGNDGLAGRFKILGQVGLGILVGATLYFNSDVKIWREYVGKNPKADSTVFEKNINGKVKYFVESKTPVTTIPFVKNHEFNYSKLLPASWRDYTWVLYIVIVIFIITAVSNGANLTDGLDGLATGTSAIIGSLLGILAYASGNLVFADYLNIMYIPGLEELSIFIAALIGACIGFLWYNSYPAQIFMGDTGSLMLGGVIASLAIIVHKELLVPIFCGVFFVEVLSVMMQVGYFKYTRKKYGEGRRVFLKAPLHHHFQVKGMHEVKIVTRFWIVTVLLVVLSIVTLKMR